MNYSLFWASLFLHQLYNISESPLELKMRVTHSAMPHPLTSPASVLREENRNEISSLRCFRERFAAPYQRVVLWVKWAPTNVASLVCSFLSFDGDVESRNIVDEQRETGKHNQVPNCGSGGHSRRWLMRLCRRSRCVVAPHARPCDAYHTP